MGPATEVVVDGRGPLVRRAVAPAAVDLQHVKKARDDLPNDLPAPGWFFGLNASITAHCSSHTRNRGHARLPKLL